MHAFQYAPRPLDSSAGTVAPIFKYRTSLKEGGPADGPTISLFSPPPRCCPSVQYRTSSTSSPSTKNACRTRDHSTSTLRAPTLHSKVRRRTDAPPSLNPNTNCQRFARLGSDAICSPVLQARQHGTHAKVATRTHHWHACSLLRTVRWPTQSHLQKQHSPSQISFPRAAILIVTSYFLPCRGLVSD